MWRRFASTAREPFASPDYGKAVSIALVFLVHAVILTVLLYPRPIVRTVTEPHDVILTLFQLPRSREPVRSVPTRRAEQKSQIAIPSREPLTTISPGLSPQPDFTGLDRALNGCDLGKSDGLTRDQRANCVILRNNLSASIAGEQSALDHPSRALHADDWAEAIKKRNTPTRVECISVGTQEIGVGATAKSTAFMVDIPCALRHLADWKRPIK